MVVDMLRQLTGIEPDHTVNPDEAVARGAALYAAFLLAKEARRARPPTFTITNVNSHSLGVEGIDPDTLRKTNVVLIPRNTPLPAKFTERFATKSENQRSIVLQVLEGESSLPGECTAIGRTVIRGLPEGLPKNWPVDVTFEYAASGRLTVQAAGVRHAHRAPRSTWSGPWAFPTTASRAGRKPSTRRLDSMPSSRWSKRCSNRRPKRLNLRAASRRGTARGGCTTCRYDPEQGRGRCGCL